MSVVAACSLIDGILMGADCRVTFREPGGENIHVDNCLKLFGLSESTVIGFVGSLPAASHLLTTLLEQIENHRDDAVTLFEWLPRLFRYKYSGMKRSNLPVSFLVASTIPEAAEMSSSAKQ